MPPVTRLPAIFALAALLSAAPAAAMRAQSMVPASAPADYARDAHAAILAAPHAAHSAAATAQDDEPAALYLYRPDHTAPAVFLGLTATMLWLSYWIFIDDNRKTRPLSLG